MVVTKVQKAIAVLGGQLKRLEEMEEVREGLIKLKDSLSGELVDVNARIRGIDEQASMHISVTGIVVPAGASKSLVQLPVSSEQPKKMNKQQEGLGNKLVRLMKGKGEFSAKEAATLAISNGYETISKNFRDPVASLLSSDARFRRVSRGRYRVRSDARLRTVKQSQKPQKPTNKSKRPSRTNGMTMADYIYRDAPRGEFCSDDLMEAIRKSGRCTPGICDKVLRKSISTRLCEDKRFRSVRLGIWKRVFPGNWDLNK